MIIKTRNIEDQSDNKTYFGYCSSYALYTEDELKDFASAFGYEIEKISWKKNTTFEIKTNIIATETEKTLKFLFVRSDLSPDFYLDAIKVGWYSRSSFFKKMDFDLSTLDAKYKKKFAKLQAKIAQKNRKSQEERKLNDIATDEIEADFMDLAEKYGFTFESQYSSNINVKNKTYIFKNNKRYIRFYGFSVKSKNIQCWSVGASYPFVNTGYSVYVGTFDQIKQVAEAYMMMFKMEALTTDYNAFLPKE